MIRRFGVAAVLLALGSTAGFADEGDPPSRVARLNFVNGSVSFRPGSVDEWAPATVNYPLTTGDHLWTDPRSQTELHVGSTAIRMDGETALAILNLDDRMTQLSVTQGTVNVHIRFLDENEAFEVDTPNVSVSLLRNGDYRITADGDNSVTIVTVRGGEAEVTGNGAAFPVRSGETARIAGLDTISQDVQRAGPMDDFDRWCDSRDRREESSVSARYVPRDMVGYEDLDTYGVWDESPQYGWVWRPRTVSIGWSPYHNGRWAWVDPWGWTWIDEAPWGFAPFHYCRWAYTGVGWVWVPGRFSPGIRPVYAPALVAFVGGGGFGVAAWFPLGPGEVYRPGYRVSERYVRNLNIVHVTNWNVTNVLYVNQGVRGAVVAVPHDAFIHGRPVSTVAVNVRGDELMRARVVGYGPGIAPVRESVIIRTGGGPVHAPPARVTERVVVVRTPPPAAPVAFAAQERALRENQGRPLDPEQRNAYRNSAPARAPMVRTVEPGRRFGRQDGAQPVQQNSPSVYQPRVDTPVRNNDRPPTARPPVQQQQQQQQQDQPRRFERPVEQQRPPVDQPRRIEQPRPAEQPRPVEQPRRIEQPRPAEQPHPVEQPRRIEQPRPVEQPRRVEQPPAQPQPRVERPVDRPAPRAEHPPERRDPPKKDDKTEKKDK